MMTNSNDVNVENVDDTADGPNVSDTCTVHAVIPVFNRIDDTMACIANLKEQTHKKIVIIVADGGSTDNTPDILKKEHPDVVVLTSKKEMWWAESTRLGIDRTLSNSTSDDDFILMLNNDTLFDPEYVATLIKHSRAHNAVVCGIVVDTDNVDNIVDAGVSLEWDRYDFKGIYERPDNIDIKLDSCVLPGRGTLIPITAVRRAGNVNSKKFPHYLADYEFTYRLKTRGGVRLAVAYNAMIKTRVDTPEEISLQDKKTGPVESWQRLKNNFSRRSKSNFLDHYRFIDLHAPAEHKRRLKLKLLKSNAFHVVRPMGPTNNGSKASGLIWYLTIRPVYLTWRFFFSPYLVTRDDVENYGLDIDSLLTQNLLIKTGYQDYYLLTRQGRNAARLEPNLRKLERHANRWSVKANRYRATRKAIQQLQTDESDQKK